MGVLTPVERVKQVRHHKLVQWAITTRRGTFVLGIIVGALIMLPIAC